MKRYAITGSVIIAVLIVAVFSVRHLRGIAASEQIVNIKVKGPEHAPVRMVVYSDFQCPACKNAVAPIEELMTQFQDSLAVEYRFYPLERTHHWALMAATFAQCAAEQNKFWELHDRLFATQETWAGSLDPLPIFAGFIQELGLNTQQFESCVQNPQTEKLIHKEYALGTKEGVQSTPTIFINGHILVGAAQLKEKGPAIITEELAHKQKPMSAS